MATLPDQLKQLKQLDLSLLKQMLSDQKKVPREWVKELIQKFIHIVKEQPNVLKINEPVIIIGDIHGQFFDLLKIISLFPSLETAPKQYLLFLGDYVDRGPMGVEVILLLMTLKVKYPKRVMMLRGNHETRQMTQIMNFYKQVCFKYDQDVYFDFMDAFDALPLVCIVNENYFCVHGGITAEGESIEELMKLKRVDEIPMKGSLCDLLWSDPVQNEEGRIEDNGLYLQNTQRNCSIFYGSQHTRNFLKKTKMITIIRAHEVQKEGYKQHLWPNWKNIPMVYTIFSAPNYCGSYGNFGAILTIKNSEFKIRQFKETNPKYYVPQKYNAFSFTFHKMFDSLDLVLKKMTRQWVAAKMPQCKGESPELMIGLYLNSKHCKQRQLGNHIFSGVVKKPAKQVVGQVDIYQKSASYFSQSQKRPNSLIYSSK